jgi:acyl-CoA thioesterase YciA
MELISTHICMKKDIGVHDNLFGGVLLSWVGQLIKIYGEIIETGRTSITVKLEARRHKPESGKQKVACEVELIFVKIDDFGEPTPI